MWISANSQASKKGNFQKKIGGIPTTKKQKSEGKEKIQDCPRRKCCKILHAAWFLTVSLSGS